MSDLTGKTIAETYRDLLQIAASSTGGGLDSTPRTVQDGSGNNSALQLSNDTVNINGTLELGGTAITKTAEQINSSRILPSVCTKYGTISTAPAVLDSVRPAPPAVSQSVPNDTVRAAPL